MEPHLIKADPKKTSCSLVDPLTSFEDPLGTQAARGLRSRLNPHQIIFIKHADINHALLTTP